MIVAIVYISGCASGAKMENMTYQGSPKSYADELNDSLEVSNVSGGKKTNPLWISEISTEAFSSAVKKSLSTQGLLSEDGRFKLEVEMLRVEQPLFGLDLKVTTYVQYTLTDSTNNSIVFDETIVAPHTATFSDSFAAIKRLRLANEGSGKKNISEFLDRLAALDIKANEIALSE